MSGKKSKDKGANFERKIAKLFTAWFQDNGIDMHFDRVPASGGLRRRTERSDYIGDISATPDDFLFTIECKCAESWKFRELIQEVVAKRPKNNPSKLSEYWFQACEEASRANKMPMLVFTKNHFPDYIMFSRYNNNIASIYYTEFMDSGVIKRFIDEEYLPYLVEPVYILKLEDFMKIVDPKMLVRN